MKLKTIISMAALACLMLLTNLAMAQRGEFVRAQWGIQGHTVDVTSRVRTFIHDGVLQLEATRFNLGIDPAPHFNKVLIIQLRERDGDLKEFSYPERSQVRLEVFSDERPPGWEGHERHDRDDRDGRDARDSRGERDDRDARREEEFDRHERGLRILRAEYGAEGNFVNVTDVLRSRVEDGRLFMRVDNFNLGVDPLPGAHKWLRVVYAFQGERQHVVVDEKTDLNLP